MEKRLQTRQTARTLADSLKDLMQRMPLRKITVLDITENCGLNRHTFYYHFTDIYDLLQWIYQNDFYSQIPVSQMQNWRECLRQAIRCAKENQIFLKNLFFSLGEEHTAKFLRPLVSQWVTALFDAFCSLSMTTAEESTLRHFVADGLTDFLLRWIRSGMCESESELFAQLELLRRLFIRAVQCSDT